jgi:DinB superfamily
MNELSQWYERRFDFSFPVELYPNVCARLRGTPARLEELIRSCPHQTVTRKPAGKWSALENAGHLLDLEFLWLARVEDYEKGTETLASTDLNNRKTDAANHNARPVEQLLAEFRTARATLMARIELFDAAMYSRVALHPRLKTPMRLVDHLFFVAEHDDHHLARIWELGRMK